MVQGHAATLQEDFSSNPAANGWVTYGDTNLFQWNATDERLDVTWDSSKTNSYFLLPLGTVLAKDDDFQVTFDLHLDTVIAGVNPAKPSTFELALGLTHLASATRTNFFRGLGTTVGGPINLVEFAYFPAAGTIFTPTIAPTIISTNGQFQPTQYNSRFELAPGSVYRVLMTYNAATLQMVTEMTRDAFPFPPPPDVLQTVSLTEGFSDLRVDHFAISSYSDAVQAGPAMFHGSVFAQGWVDNITLTFPDPPFIELRGRFNNGCWEVCFQSRLNWSYALERKVSGQPWMQSGDPSPGDGNLLTLSDTNSPSSTALYRVAVSRP